MLKTAFENLRSRSPLIHNITNYVTVNDCANMVLACGASPIMADDAAEVEEITAICGGLNINIGTLNSRTVTSMLLAGKKANQLGHPVVLDPVGAGASHLRTDTALRHDEQHHRHGLPALCPDGGLCHRQPRPAAGGHRCGGVRHGSCG